GRRGPGPSAPRHDGARRPSGAGGVRGGAAPRGREPAACSAGQPAMVRGHQRYMDLEPIQFAFNLLTRSLRITHDNLKLRDPQYVAAVDRWFAASTAEQSGVDVPRHPPPPPLFTPFRLRDLLLANRVVVSPMCQYCSEDGTP